uniref:KASH domain-containing protein n=1 Tax=Macrostomum lignano TaxID=282301 RepID=A0A1I8IRH9_9PLAT
TRLFTACRSKIDRIRELERRLREVASAEGLAGADSGATNGVDEESRAGRVIARWRRLLAEATQRDAQLAARSGSAASLEHEAERMSEWLAATLRELQQQPTVPSSTAEDGDLANVEASARRLKELVDRLERHKSAAMSLQLCLRRPDLSERQRGRIADCLSLWRQAYAEARRRHRRLQSSFAGCAQLSDRLAEISRGVAEARQLALENRPRLSDTAAQLAAKATGAAAAEARVAKAAELVRKWAGYAAVPSSFDHGAAAGESVAAPAAGSPEMAKVAGQLTRLEAELADALRRLRAVKRELALRESSYERLDSVDAVASVPRVEDADADYYDDEPGSAAATAAAAAAAAAKLRVASSSGVGRRRGSLLNTLYRGMLLSLPIEAFFLLLCGIGYLLKPGCETDCSEWPNMFSVKSQGLPY